MKDKFLRHRELKKQFPSTIILLKWNDGYVTFDNDAYILSRVCDNPKPQYLHIEGVGSTMVGQFLDHCLDVYLPTLVNAKYRVAVEGI